MSELFEEFLRTYEVKGEENKYRNRLAQMAASGDKSVVVDYEDLIQFNTDLGQNLLSQPDESLKEFRIAAFEVLSTENASYASQIRNSLNVRIRGITDKVSLRKVDTSYLDKMIAVSGMVVRSSELRPLLTDAAFICPNGHLTKVVQEGVTIRRPLKCDGCEETRNLELDEKKSSFIDSQVLRVQELPEELPPGQLPRFFDVDVIGDIVNTARPGDRLVLTGIVRAEQDVTPGQARTRVFRSKIDSNLIEVAGKDPGQIQITKEDEFLIRSVAANPDAYQRLIKSIAPAILGHDAVKEAILLLLVGGPQTILPDGTKLRGDINVFIVGDPGVAKSEMLKFASQVAPRGMFASGKGSTAAGLSAAVIREKNTFMLEAGVVVLADQGIACMTEDMEIYTGQELMSVGEVWKRAQGEVLGTKSGREGKEAFIPVTIYDGKARADIPGVAFSILRKKHQGDIVKLTLASGLTLKVTPEHLLRRTTEYKNKWVRADKIRAGDELKAPVKLFKPAATLSVPPAESYVIGCAYGDGWLGGHGITISQSKVNSDVIEAVRNRLPDVFSLYDKGEKERSLGKYLVVERSFQLYTNNRDFLRRTRLLLTGPSTDNILMLDDSALWSFIAGVFDTDGDFNHVREKITAARLYPTDSKHELAVLLYALRRLGVYARIHGLHKSIPQIQITDGDITRFIAGIKEFSVKVARERPESLIIAHKGDRSINRGRERVVRVEKEHYDGFVYDLSVGKYHNYESSLVFIHNCIDEFDKMKEDDRSALHEQMEQQTVTIAKGGIFATLNARTAILAAANPIFGKYDPYKNLTDNITLPIPLLTRFDLIFVIKDTPTPAQDERLATHILDVHRRGSYTEPPPVQFDLMKKYITYAKKISPKLTMEAENRLKEFYLQLRRSVAEGQIAATPRTLESLIRLSSARARLMLREQVLEEDALAAIALMNRMVEDVLTDTETKTKADFGILLGQPVGERNKSATSMEIFRTMEGPEKNKPVELKLFRDELLKSGRFKTDDEVDKMIQRLIKEGIIWENKPGFYRRVQA
jgi:replicative DNA helicase Mcm